LSYELGLSQMRQLTQKVFSLLDYILLAQLHYILYNGLTGYAPSSE
jgi:hypothetical protein